jgi:hypothetical protein
MSVFDFLFIACFFGSVIYAAWIGSFILRRRWPSAGKHGLRWAEAISLYLLVLVVVSVAAPRRVLPSNGVLRYDDWCLAVEKATSTDTIDSNSRPEAGNRFVIVTLTVISKAGRVRQAAPRGSLVYLLDGSDNRYDVSKPGQAAFEKLNGSQPLLTTKLNPNSAFTTTCVFEVPRSTRELFIAHRHGTAFPNILIIGEGFRKPKVIRLAL